MAKAKREVVLVGVVLIRVVIGSSTRVKRNRFPSRLIDQLKDFCTISRRLSRCRRLSNLRMIRSVSTDCDTTVGGCASSSSFPITKEIQRTKALYLHPIVPRDQPQDSGYTQTRICSLLVSYIFYYLLIVCILSIFTASFTFPLFTKIYQNVHMICTRFISYQKVHILCTIYPNGIRGY